MSAFAVENPRRSNTVSTVSGSPSAAPACILARPMRVGVSESGGVRVYGIGILGGFGWFWVIWVI